LTIEGEGEFEGTFTRVMIGDGEMVTEIEADKDGGTSSCFPSSLGPEKNEDPGTSRSHSEFGRACASGDEQTKRLI
jgi:hypothetical protein